MVIHSFHPAVAAWFSKHFAAPTEPQALAWPSIQAWQHTLIAAPTGSGKTLAAFLAAIDDLVRQGQEAPLPDETRAVYVSPLKALSNDIQRNLEQPLEGIREELAAGGFTDVAIRTLVRTGDTPAAVRAAMRRRPPHIIVTTPESLYILLTSEGGRKMLATTRTVIVDEIHALAGNKRGSHLALTLERLEALVSPGLVRIGLSATQHPIEEIARFLVGTADGPDGAQCTVVDTGHVRARDLAIEIPRSPLEAVMSTEVKQEVYDRLAELILAHRTTLVFVNTRRMAERVTRHLSERVGEEQIASHHGSLAKEHRLKAEQRLKAGELRALVATASLELGIDIGEVDLVCQLGSTRTIAMFLQRVGRSGHAVSGLPKGRLFPLSRDELVECAALLDAVRHNELDRVGIPEHPLDVMAQQIVAMVACEEWREDELFDRMRRAYPYRKLTRQDFDAVVRMLAEGFTTRRGRRNAYLYHDAVNGRLRGRRGTRIAALTNGGVIPENADYEVVVEPSGTFIGTLNEDFAIESLPGDIFQLGNTSWRILKIELGRVRVEDAHGQPPTIPFWFGEASARSDELSAALSRLREAIAKKLTEHPEAVPLSQNVVAAFEWLVEEVGIAPAAAEQIVDYLAAARAALGVLPTHNVLVLERFFDETGGMQLVIHAPFGNRINRAWGLALRKRFCRKFNFELQAAASEDAIVLSLGPTHSFPLDEVMSYLSAATVREVLVQALLDAPMFTVRWRWNATCALAVLRFRNGGKVPARLQRMDAEDLVSVVFPDQRACVENIAGNREIPDHPLVAQTLRDCLTEAMDIEGLTRLLAAIEQGEIRVVARDLTEPSPLAQEILTAGPYSFLDDAPLEERRTLAVQSRRWLDPQTASDLGTLDPQAIARVREEAWPEAMSADELHDALVLFGFVTEEEGQRGPGWSAFLGELAAEGRAAVLRPGDSGATLWIAAERLPQLAVLFPSAPIEPPISAPASLTHRAWSREEALADIIRGRLEGLGPITAGALARSAGLGEADIHQALAALEAEGFVLRGRFTPDFMPATGGEETEWCERRLLARIHRYTLNRLRQEIEPATAADFMRFLFAWQHVTPEHQLEGPQGLAGIVEQLEGIEAPAAAWEAEILPARLKDYDSSWLDALCLSGKITWLRLTPPKALQERSAGPVRTTPIVLVSRKNLAAWTISAAQGSGPDAIRPSPLAQNVAEYLQARGASFFEEITEGTRLLRSQVEDALGELVAWGLVTADSFTGLRALLVPSEQRRPIAGGRRRVRTAAFGIEDAGRWVTVRHGPGNGHTPSAGIQETGAALDAETIERLARILLRRYGVVFRRIIEREPLLPPWRDLLRVYRRLEARGEIRGGHFVGGFSGEQYGLPEAVGMLRDTRRKSGAGELVSLSAADPLNLVGIVTPGARVPALTGNRVLYRDGVPIAAQIAKEFRVLGNAHGINEWEVKNALVRRTTRSKFGAGREPLAHIGEGR